jgi:hypothetical protein
VRFVLFVIDHASNSGNPAEMAAIDVFNDSLRSNGHWVFACGIGAPTTAALIDARDGLSDIVDGSLFHDINFYSGFWIITADSSDHAHELALAASRACNRRVELRPLLG